MTLTDAGNAGFLFGGFLFNLLNLRRLWIDRVLKGCSPWPTFFFACWGFQSLHLWWSQHLFFSFYADLFTTGGNTAWLLLFAWIKLCTAEPEG